MIASQRHLFEIPDDIAYLNCAYMSPLMKPVVAASSTGLQRKACPWTVTPQDFFTESEQARGLFGRLIGAPADDVAIVPSASYGIATAATNLPVTAGQEILVLRDQFPSNVYSWRDLAEVSGAELRTLQREQDGDWTRVILDAISDRTAIAALPHNHWTDGSLIDLVAVGQKLRSVGAALVLDLTQSLGAMPFSVADVQPDFMVSACYKWLLGPYSVGFMYVAPKWQQGRALEQGWITRAGSENFARLLDYTDALQPGARRFDMGERSNFALLPGAISAMEHLLDWTPEAISETLGARTSDIAAKAMKLGLLAPPEGTRAPHFLGLRFPDGAPETLVQDMAAQQVYISQRGDSMRVTPHLYNTDADTDRLIQALSSII
ncbi:MAG: aminotransferase class V-fold PLP-dependent enzyme [Minwuia sp.]|nr:aminotransferase class V-fold PLP-dependent enzyme [Minwuia sp.]